MTLNLLKTEHSSHTSDSSKTDTDCKETSAGGDVNCSSRQVGSGEYEIFTSTVEASDGNTYELRCILTGIPIPFRRNEAVTARSGDGPASYGCQMQPDRYQARRDGGQFKVLVFTSTGKSKELTFRILSSKPTVSHGSPETPKASPTAEKTAMKVISTPQGADIELDGSFVGNTPSTLQAAIGEHSIKISKPGFKPWERTIKAVGGEVTVSAELQAETK